MGEETKKLNVLFVCSGNSKIDDGKDNDGIVPFIKTQGESLKSNGLNLEYFLIKGKGIKGYYKHISILKKFLRERNKEKNKEKQFDIIHAHYGFCGWVAVLGGGKLPVVISFMGDDLYGDADEKGRKKFSDYIYIAMNIFLQCFVDFIIVKSLNLAKNVFFKKKMQILPNGVNFEHFRPMKKEEALKKLQEPGGTDNPSILKLVGSDIENKKVVLFLGDKSNPRKNFPLLEKALESMDTSRIELIAPFPVKGKEVPLYLNLADVFVMPSFKEGSPNVVKEAMACNCPIVATDVGDAKDVIEGTEGCYVTSLDWVETAEKIKLALAFGRKTNGRDAIKHLEVNVIAKRLIDIYKSVIN